MSNDACLRGGSRCGRSPRTRPAGHVALNTSLLARVQHGVPEDAVHLDAERTEKRNDGAGHKRYVLETLSAHATQAYDSTAHGRAGHRHPWPQAVLVCARHQRQDGTGERRGRSGGRLPLDWSACPGGLETTTAP